MQYLGGKARVAKFIAPHLLNHLTPGATYWEPFLGGGSVAELVVPRFGRAVLSDAHPELIRLWQALADGWEPPHTVTESEYRELKAAEPSPTRAFAGFGASFSGKWFGGYARPHVRQRDKAGSNRRTLLRQINALRGAEFRTCAFDAIKPCPGDVVYLDPPYAGTTAYAGVPPFDSAHLWAVAEKWSRAGVWVYVSEFSAPPGWFPVWAREHTDQMRRGESRTDALYRFANT